MNEFKIQINPDETLVSYRDFSDYINRPYQRADSESGTTSLTVFEIGV